MTYKERPWLRRRRVVRSTIAFVLAFSAAGWESSAQRHTKAASVGPAPNNKSLKAWNCPCSLWPQSAVPPVPDVGPDNSVELGVKFRSEVNGFVTGIRFYKAPRNTGVHVGSLWTAEGTWLASVTFNKETASGWQTAMFASPVAVTADTTYVASYHSPTGHYAFSAGYFTSDEESDGPLSAPVTKESPNGVHRYSTATVFPSTSFNAANYWVDVVFVPGRTATTVGAAPPAPDPAGIQFADTLTTGFALGTLDNVAITGIADGEVMLAPAAGSEFNDAATPRDWRSTAWDKTGASVFADGVAAIDGARLGSLVSFPPRGSLEFAATFSGDPNQHIGFAVSLEDGPWAIFSSYDGLGLYARTHDGARPIDTRILGVWSARPHRFRIEWQPRFVAFSIDGNLVARHETSIGGRMRALASDLAAGGDPLRIEWIHVSPYKAEGTFTSRVFDGGATMKWPSVVWSAEEPVGTGVTVSIRTGNTAVPDETWTEFERVSASGAPVSSTSRYIQYRLQLNTSASDSSPVVREVIIRGTP